MGSRYKKKYDSPKTPYQRLLDSEHIADEVKLALKQKHQDLNPFALMSQGVVARARMLTYT